MRNSVEPTFAVRQTTRSSRSKSRGECSIFIPRICSEAHGFVRSTSDLSSPTATAVAMQVSLHNTNKRHKNKNLEFSCQCLLFMIGCLILVGGIRAGVWKRYSCSSSVLSAGCIRRVTSKISTGLISCSKLAIGVESCYYIVIFQLLTTGSVSHNLLYKITGVILYIY